MCLFLNPNHVYCVAETGYLAGKAGPSAQDRENSMLGSWLTGGAMLHWPIANEFFNSLPALLSPFLFITFYSLFWVRWRQTRLERQVPMKMIPVQEIKKDQMKLGSNPRYLHSKQLLFPLSHGKHFIALTPNNRFRTAGADKKVSYHLISKKKTIWTLLGSN